MTDRFHRPPLKLDALPEHLCPVCTSVRFRREPSCADCRAPRPADGWDRVEDASDPLVGRTVDGRFFISRRVTRCAEATLYRASCLAVAHDFGLWVTPLDDFEGDTLYENMSREVKVLRSLDTAIVVSIHELLELPGNRAAVLMDYVEGPCLANMAHDDAPLEVGQALELGAQLLRGLNKAHQAGLIHRRLDPTSIVVEQISDGSERLRLINFGLVRLKNSVDRTDPWAKFISPERRRGDAPDVRSNIYAAGAILFFMLTGQPPRPKWNSGGTWGLRLNGESRSARAIRSDDSIPVEVDKLVDAMLSRKRRARPGSLSDAIDTLESCARALGQPAAQGFGLEDSTRPADSLEAPTVAGQTEREPVDLSASGSFSRRSKQTPAFTHETTRVDTDAVSDTGSLEQLSIPQTLEKRLSRESLPRDVDPRSSVSFWPQEARNTEDYGWINSPQTGGRSKKSASPGPDVGTIVCAATSHDQRIAFANDRREVWVVSSQGSDQPKQVSSLPQDITSLALSGEQIAVGLDNGMLMSLDVETGASEVLLETIDRAAIVGIAVDTGGETLVACTASGRAYVGALESGLADHDWGRARSTDPARAVSLTTQAGTFAVLRTDGKVELRGLTAPFKPTAQFNATASARAVALSPDGQLIAVISDAQAKLYHAYSGQLVSTFEGLEPTLFDLCFDASNALIGVCQHEGAPVLWNIAINSPIAAPSRQKNS